MATLNRVLLIGNLTRDPELRYTPQGTAVVKLGLAVNRRYRDRNGEPKEETCFVTIVAWDKQAEVCNQYLHKGRPIFVEGRLTFRSWEDNAGQKRNVLEVRAERIQFLGAPPASSSSETDTEGTPETEQKIEDSSGELSHTLDKSEEDASGN